MKENPNFDFYNFNLPKNEQKEQQHTPDEPTVIPPTEPSSPRRAACSTAFIPPTRPSADLLQRARHAYSRAGWALSVMLLVWYAGSFIAQIIGLFVLPAWLGMSVEALGTHPIFLTLTSTLPLYVFGLPALALILMGLPAERPQKQRFGVGKFILAFFIAVGVASVGNVVGNTLMSVIGGLSGYEFSNMLEQTLDMPLWLNLVCAVVLAPIFEELIFRKLLMDRLRPYGELGAIVMTSLLFGAIHTNFYQFFYAALLGALFAYVYLRSGKVWVTMLLHALFNLFGGVLPHLLMQKFDVDALLAAADEMEMMSLIFENFNNFLLFGLYELIFYSLAAVGLILLLVLRKRLFLVPTRDELPRTWRARPMFGNAGVIFVLAFCAVLFLLVMINTAQPLI